MSDILIRGMEMPGHCIDCPLMVDRFDTDACALQSQEANEAFESWDDMRRGCPLVPIPEGHGRIVDAAEILEKANNSPWFDGDVSELGLLLGSEVTTIVPAEGGTDDV